MKLHNICESRRQFIKRALATTGALGLSRAPDHSSRSSRVARPSRGRLIAREAGSFDWALAQDELQ